MRNVLLAFITKIRILNSRRYYAIVEVTLRNLSAIRQNPLGCHMQMRARERLVRINDETELPLNNSLAPKENEFPGGQTSGRHGSSPKVFNLPPLYLILTLEAVNGMTGTLEALNGMGSL